MTRNLDKLPALVAERPELGQAGLPFDAVEQARVLRKLADETPKSMKWRMRAGVGDKVRWYQLPEEVAHWTRVDEVGAGSRCPSSVGPWLS